jgi:hypothetical protein
MSSGFSMSIVPKLILLVKCVASKNIKWVKCWLHSIEKCYVGEKYAYTGNILSGLKYISNMRNSFGTKLFEFLM